MSLAADTREAVRKRPFLVTALRAGVVNYTAAASWLVTDAGLDGDREAIATALRRFGEGLEPYETDGRRASVSMRSGVDLVDEGSTTADECLVRVGDSVVVEGGDRTAIVARGSVDSASLAHVLDRLRVSEVAVAAAGVAGGELVLVVERRDGATAVRVVEEALSAVPFP